MASIFGHAILGVGIAKIARKKTTWKIIGLAALCTIIPDADVLGHAFGIPYEHPFGHRGFTHSILFALLLAVFIKKVFFRNSKLTSTKGVALVLLFFFSTLSHGLLDSLTNGGLGVNYFFPFHNERYFFPFRPIQVSPIGIKNFFSEWGLRVIISEVVWICIPSTGLILLRSIINRFSSK
ncbi:MAG: metal-dependent hydrolase [Cytophagaceae bacterium]